MASDRINSDLIGSAKKLGGSESIEGVNFQSVKRLKNISQSYEKEMLASNQPTMKY
jgi:hypothetical protein